MSKSANGYLTNNTPKVQYNYEQEFLNSILNMEEIKSVIVQNFSPILVDNKKLWG